MTIAVGLVCSDGVVLCADTLLSANYRQQGSKLWLWRDGKAGVSVAVTGAGPYVLLRLAKEAIFTKLDLIGRKVQQPGDIKHRVIETTIASIHDDHIDKASDWDRNSGYALSLLVGVRQHGKAVLYETDKRVCNQVDSLVCIGSAAPVGNYVASTLFSPSVSVMWGQVVGAYLIQQTKAYGDGCGGDTDLIVLRHSGA